MMYGAYRLRKTYARNMSIGLGISILLFLICLIAPSIHWEDNSIVYTMTEVALEIPPEIYKPELQSKSSKSVVKEIKVETKANKQVKKGENPKIVNDKHVEPNLTKDTNLTDSIQKENSNPSQTSDTLQGISNTEGEGDLPFDFVDVMPQFPGGQGSLKRFIASKSVYPGSAFQNKIEGTVIVGFVIDKYGRLRNPKILKSLYPYCDEEALRVVRLIPDWIPAKNQGRNVSINFSMPIEFKLKR